jgi:hypothetical protein
VGSAHSLRARYFLMRLSAAVLGLSSDWWVVDLIGPTLFGSNFSISTLIHLGVLLVGMSFEFTSNHLGNNSRL